MKRRILCLLLCMAMLVPLCSCGGNGKYKAVKTLDRQSYSIAVRSGDSAYHYIDRALKELSFEGVVDELAEKWLGSDGAVSFPREENALEELGYVEPRSFTIGVDLDSYPMCFESGNGYDGFDVELAERLCEKLGWTLKVRPIHSEDTYVNLNSGNIDCAWGGIRLDPNSKQYTVLVTYMSTNVVIAGRSDGGSSLGGKSLMMGSSQYYLDLMAENDRAAARLGQIGRVQAAMPEYFTALDNGECDFILTTEAAVDYKNRH